MGVSLNISIDSGVKYKIVLEARRGNGFKGDIAVDDIFVTRGTCPGKTISK